MRTLFLRAMPAAVLLAVLRWGWERAVVRAGRVEAGPRGMLVRFVA